MIVNFLGDLIFGDQPIKFGYGFDSIHKGKKYSGVFSGVEDILKEADYNVGNFEAVIKPRPKSANVSNWSMCCDENITNELVNSKINILSVANNHTMDYGEYWFDNTVKTIEKSGIKVIGLKNEPFVILGKGTEQIAIVGVSYLKTRHKELPYFFSPTETEWANLFNGLKTRGVIKVLLYIHWGNEFVKKPTQSQIDILKTLAKFRFFAIIGHHPHILQTKLRFKDIPVFFSLGNFVSDYWQIRARETEILHCLIEHNVLFQSTPCLISQTGLPIILGEKAVNRLENFDGQISSKEEIFKQRQKLRKEYFQEFLKNFYRIKNKPMFFKWGLKRMVYLIKNFREEKSNPNIVYEKYDN